MAPKWRRATHRRCGYRAGRRGCFSHRVRGYSWCRGSAGGGFLLFDLGGENFSDGQKPSLKICFAVQRNRATSPISRRDSIRLVATVRSDTLPAGTLRACVRCGRLRSLITSQSSVSSSPPSAPVQSELFAAENQRSTESGMQPRHGHSPDRQPAQMSLTGPKPKSIHRRWSNWSINSVRFHAELPGGDTRYQRLPSQRWKNHPYGGTGQITLRRTRILWLTGRG